MRTTALHTAFFTGDYKRCCDLAAAEPISQETKSYWFRALLHLGHLDEALSLAPTDGALDAALRLYASTHALRNSQGHSSEGWNEGIFAEAERVAGLEGDRDAAAVLLAIVYSWSGRLEEAYRVAVQSASLEAQLLLVTFLAQIRRFDLAERKMERLKQAFVEDVAFQLVEAQLALQKGGTFMKDAIYIYQELIEVHGRTTKLLNLHAAALLLVGRHSEAEAIILDVINNNPRDATALSLLVSLSVTRGAGIHLINDQLARLAVADKTAPFLKRLERAAAVFEQHLEL